MFSLLYGLWEYVFWKQELRVLIIGLDKSGKTTMLEKIKVRSAQLAFGCMYASLQASGLIHLVLYDVVLIATAKRRALLGSA